MYAWKCWRETRACVFVLLMLFVVIAVFVVLAPGIRIENGWWSFDRSEYVHNPAAMVRMMWPMIFSALWASGWFAGALLGVTSSGSEIEPGTIEYLWTRPRTRRSFLWTHWGVCTAEIFLVATIPAYLAAALLGALTGRLGEPLFLLAPLLIALVGLPILGISTLMTGLRRNGRGGLIFTSGIVVSYMILRQIANGPLHMNIPPLIMGPVAWLISYNQPDRMAFPVGSLANAIILTVALPLCAQYVLKRAEV